MAFVTWTNSLTEYCLSQVLGTRKLMLVTYEEFEQVSVYSLSMCSYTYMHVQAKLHRYMVLSIALKAGGRMPGWLLGGHSSVVTAPVAKFGDLN